MTDIINRFRTRNDVLNDMISLYRTLPTFAPDLEKDVQNVQSFLKIEISSFARGIIEGMLNCKLVDTDFCFDLFKFDQSLFEEIIKQSIDNFYKTFGFNETLNIVPMICKTFAQAIFVYEEIFKMTGEDMNHKKDLSIKLDAIRMMTDFDKLPQDQISRVLNMCENLPSPTE